MLVYYYQRTTAFEAGESEDSESALFIAHEAAAIRKYCSTAGLGSPLVCEDIAVPWTQDFANRATAATLLDQIQPGDAIVVYSLERIFSSCQDTLAMLNYFVEHQIHLYVMEIGGDITERHFSRDFNGLLQIFAGLERRRAAERIKLVKQRQRERGRYLGGSRPFGYMIHSNGRLLENPMEQRVLKRIMLLKQQGKSLRAIASEVSTPVMPISFKTVQRVLQRHAE